MTKSPTVRILPARLIAIAAAMVLVVLPGGMRAVSQAQSRLPDGMPGTALTETGGASGPSLTREEMEDLVKGGVPGVTAILMRGGKPLFRLDVGKIGPETQYPVASASKWMTAALVMTVVDEGKLSLDEPASKTLPEFQNETGRVTLRQLLAQTSGEGSLKSLVDIMQDPRLTLAQSAAQIAKRPLEDPPGTVFKYGGPGFQVAGAMVEAVTGRRWADLFKERIARPLGMTHTYWEHLPNRGVSPADTFNPLLQGGVVTTADDYMRFLTMLAQQGMVAGRRILSAAAVEAMETAQTLGKPMAYLPPGVNKPMQYALGNWCETWTSDGKCILVSSPGAFGTYPWLDRQSGLYGIFFLKDRLPPVVEHLTKARAAMLATEK
jgi:CubicO group peptidase (beta-lactamase class C family)